MNASDLECLSLEKAAPEGAKIATLTDWAEGISLYKVPNLIYVPQHRFPISYGFVPEEAINYALHFDINREAYKDTQIELAEIEQSSDEVCILGNIYSHVFSHWMEELLKVIVLEEHGFEGDYIIANDYPGFCRESIELLGVSPERLRAVNHVTSYKFAFFTTTIHHMNANRYPRLVAHRRDRLHSAVGKGDGVGDRVWIERGKHANVGRDVINKEEVYACVSKYGFIPVDFALHDFKKQICIDRAMKVMLGPHGSAFQHCGFMQNRQTVIEIFSPNYINPSVIQICQAFQHRYNQIVPLHTWFLPYKYANEILVKIDHLELVLSSLK